MLMIVPLMIWSALTEIDSQAWTNDTTTADRRAHSSAATRAGDAPKNGPGSEPRTGVR